MDKCTLKQSASHTQHYAKMDDEQKLPAGPKGHGNHALAHKSAKLIDMPRQYHPSNFKTCLTGGTTGKEGHSVHTQLE